MARNNNNSEPLMMDMNLKVKVDSIPTSIPAKVDALISKEKAVETPPPSKSMQQKAIAVSFYWITSLSLVFINKVVMAGNVTHLDAPLFMSWTQFLVTFLCCIILGEIGKCFSPFSFFPPFEYDPLVAMKVMPLTAVFLGMIVFNNLCLKYVEVSFYQVARSLAIVFNIVFSFLVLGKRTNRAALCCCALITVGYVLGCDGEVRFDWLGAIFGLLSSLFVALNAIYVKRVLPAVQDSSEKLMCYNNLNSVMLLPIIMILCTDEPDQIFQHRAAFLTETFWAVTLLAGLFGFLINFASYIQIKFTSPLTHNVSGTAKSAAQTIIALQIFQNPTTPMGLVGCAIVILGSFAYSRVR